MAVYGIDFYARTKYGPNQVTNFSVAPFIATQVDYGTIALSWQSPVGQWSRIRLQRSASGWVNTFEDGDTLLDFDSNSGPVTSYLDVYPRAGNFVYYTMFVGLPLQDWNGSFEYLVGDLVSYDGVNYHALIAGSGYQPDISPDAWEVVDDPDLLEWAVAGRVSTMVVADHQYSDRLYDLVPRPYKIRDDAPLDQDSIAENDYLYRFLQIFGFNLDVINTEYDALLYLHDPNRVSEANAAHLARQFGFEPEPEVEPRVRRARLRNHNYVARKRGTLEGIRDAVSSTLGWDVDVSVGPNLMLNDDQASFAHPWYDDWRADINYPEGERVRYMNYIYEANPGGAYGEAQRPSADRVSNTWWTWVNNYLDSNVLYNPSTDGISTWEHLAGDGTRLPGTMVIAIGMQDPEVPLDETRNLGYIKNSTAAATDLEAFSVSRIVATDWNDATAYVRGQYVQFGGRTYKALLDSTGVIPSSDISTWREENVRSDILDRAQVIRDGIPLPAAYLDWEPGLVFAKGQKTSYKGLTFQALVDNPTGPPTGRPNRNSEWDFVNNDLSLITGSAYAKSQNATAEPVPTTLFLRWFTERGGVIGESLPTTTWAYLDTFDQRVADPRVPLSSGDQPYVTVNGTWDRTLGWAYAKPASGVPAGSVCLMYANSERSDVKVSATFRTPNGSKDNGIVVRLSDASNFWAITRTGVVKYVAGTKTPVATFAAPIEDGDRVTVDCSGGTITVYRYGSANVDGTPSLSQIASVADTFNSTATNVGLFLEV